MLDKPAYWANVPSTGRRLGLMQTNSSVAWPITSTASWGVRSQPTCRCKRRPLRTGDQSKDCQITRAGGAPPALCARGRSYRI